MQAYFHSFRAGQFGYTDHTTVLFYTQGDRATKAAAHRIADAVAAHVGHTLASGDVDYIKGQLVRLDRVDSPDQYGLVGYMGKGMGGAVKVAVKA